MFRKLFNRRNLPWIVAAIFAAAFVITLFMRRTTAATAAASGTINGVVQDSSGRRVAAWIDPMYSQGPPHVYKSNRPGTAPDCGMRLVPLYADDSSGAANTSTVSGYANVSLPPARQQIVGVKLAKVEVRDLSRTLRTVGRVSVDERRVAQIRTKFEGFVEALFVNFTGQSVRRGQPLLSIYSPDVLATQQDLILAERSRAQFGGTLVDAARRRLLLWDMSAADVDRVARTGRPLRAIPLLSPVSGTVMTKNATLGARVMPTDTLYEIADLSSVWVLADVYEQELPYVRTGQSAQVSTSGRAWVGRVAFVSPVVEEQTRTAKVRIELANSDGFLKPEMFADVMLQPPIGEKLTVPESAVLQTGTRSIVFVARGNGQFEPRQVVTGVKAGGFYEIQSGVSAGETVAAEANFLIDSESRLKSAISRMQ